MKTFVIDTSVLLYHEDSIHAFPESTLVIPIEVLEEIDSKKTRMDSVGNAARYVNRFLDDIRSHGNLQDGIKLENEQIIKVVLDGKRCLEGLDNPLPDTVDNRVIAIAKKISLESEEVSLLSRDICMRVKCDSIGVPAENYTKEKAIIKRRGAYSGVSVLDVDSRTIDDFYSNGKIEIEDLELQPNECIVLKGGTKQSALAVHKSDGIIRKLVYAGASGFNVQGIFPRSKEQVFSFELLLDPEISLITLTGKAGCGKTLMSIAAAVSMLAEGRCEKIIITRPVQSMSKDIGFLPGTKFEKMEPWIQPILDNLSILFKNGKDYISLMMEKGEIEIEALTYIRGRSIPNAIFILDEAQNITHQEAKAVLTRMGEGSKLIMLGDLEQIDAPHLDSANSGLSSIVEKFKDFELSGHITLLKGERSALATHAAKIL